MVVGTGVWQAMGGRGGDSAFGGGALANALGSTGFCNNGAAAGNYGGGGAGGVCIKVAANATGGAGAAGVVRITEYK